MSDFKKYATAFGCTIAEAISNRDWPATLEQCTEWFVEAEGRAPTDEEIRVMSPNTAEQVREEAAHLKG